MFSQGLQHFTAEAVVPEQLLHYVTAVAGSRPLACAGFPAYLLEGHLVLVPVGRHPASFSVMRLAKT